MTDRALDVESMLAGRAALLRDACERSLAYLDQVADRAVAPASAAVAALSELDVPLPHAGLASHEVLRSLDEIGSPATVASNGPRYFGFVTGAALPVAQAASWLGAAWDQNSALTVMSPAAARLNEISVRWITGLLGLPAAARGGFVSGATMANATCLAAARDAVLTAHGSVSSSPLSLTPALAVVEVLLTSVADALGEAGRARFERYAALAELWGRPGPDGADGTPRDGTPGGIPGASPA